jgi:hypothetical protein
MGIDCIQLVKYIINPVLASLGLKSNSAIVLLTGTAAIESHMGRYLHQKNGPALGIYQMEPNTHTDIWVNFLKFNKELANKVFNVADIGSSNIIHERLIYNLKYATALARIHYLRVKEELPQQNDASGMAYYHKKYYNTVLGDSDKLKSTLIFQKIIDDPKKLLLI